MSSSMYRSRARDILRGNWPTAILVTLVSALLGGLDYSGPTLKLNFDAMQSPATIFLPLPPATLRVLSMVFGISLIGLIGSLGVYAIVRLILGGAIEVGYCRYQLNLYDRRDSSFSDLFSFMDHFGTALCMNLIRGLIVVIGSICLVIPGIIFGYGLSMAGYIMAEDPDCSAVDALKRSWQLMDGHKMDLFILELSFIGWLLLTILTAGIGIFFLNPYTEAARTSFYRQLRPQNRYSSFR